MSFDLPPQWASIGTVLTAVVMGEGLKKGTTDYEAVKSQIINGQFDVSGNIPHRAILDYNIASNNEEYERATHEGDPQCEEDMSFNHA